MKRIIEKNTEKRTQFVNITKEVEEIVSNSESKEGIVLVFSPHTTTGVAINEDEKGLIKDMEQALSSLIEDKDYQHDKIDNNADSHLRAMILGHQVAVSFSGTSLDLGTWQSIFFVELDGPRRRKIIVRIVEGA